MKILFVLQCSWGANIGIAKVHYDIKSEYEKLGHTIDVLSYDDFYPNGQTKISKLISPQIDKLILQKLKVIAKNYDVIDANYSCIPYPKELFNFTGLLVFRSHGIQPVYRKVEQSKEYLNMLSKIPIETISFKTKIGNIYRFLLKSREKDETVNSILNADLVHCLNQAEYDYVVSLKIPKENIVLLPNGISDAYIETAYINSNQKRDEIIFLASWTPRKGIFDFNDIFLNMKKTFGQLKIKAVGTFYDENYVRKSIDSPLVENLIIVPHFTSNQLSSHLKNARLGIFPSYIEGFGLAVVEQLAAGIPVVAYDIPGPRDILKGLDDFLLVPVGDTSSMRKSLLHILSMDEDEYITLSKKCIARAQEYRVSIIANDFLNAYKKGLNRLKDLSNQYKSTLIVSEK